jgi:TctA family transporter
MTPYIAISFLIGLSKGTAAASAVSAILLIAVAIPFARVALMFGLYEMAAILAFALVFIAGLSGGSLFKGLAAGGLGIFLGSVGPDPQSGLPRMTFGYTELMDGMPLLAVAISTLALSEMFIQADAMRNARRGGPVGLKRTEADTLCWPEFRLTLLSILRGTAVGAFGSWSPMRRRTLSSTPSRPRWTRRSWRPSPPNSASTSPSCRPAAAAAWRCWCWAARWISPIPAEPTPSTPRQAK